MKDRQFLEFMNMLEALRLTARQQVTTEPIIVFNPDLSDALFEEPTAPLHVARADQMAFYVLRFAEDRNAGN